MQIANPIYDVVFKHLMQNNEIAILILSNILGEEIISLDLLPQESAVVLENRNFTVYRLDFSARIKTANGEEKHVIIEIQKAKFAADIMRFRRYLGDQYKKGFPVPGNEIPKATPIISVYFLGYKLDYITAPIIEVCRSYRDAATKDVIPVRETFIENLTHDSFVIQIPYLSQNHKTATEKLLSIFDQERKIQDDAHVLDIDEQLYPTEYRRVIRCLNWAVSEPEIRHIMDVEDEILAEFADIERKFAGMEKTIEENAKALKMKDKALERKKKTLEKREQVIKENVKVIREKDKALAAKERELAEKDRLIAELRGM
uniref:PD-(D/E)XK nuclease family transposase n=1 Tax=Candidatus Kentrum sp. MB TaxID=2138164 RepID=A0A450XNI9_9GAMM|nr:MAG: hypothetical protein BECKMB1821G_GA0114241_10727 [Candidatus Kentron sp. MB]